MDYEGDADRSGLRGTGFAFPIPALMDHTTRSAPFLETSPLKVVNPLDLMDTVIDAAFLKYDQKTADFLKKHGDEDIETLVVRRAPVAEWINAALNAISLGTWNRSRAQYDYDKLYHLSLIINGRYAVQRLSRVSITLKDADSPGSETMNVPLPTFGEPLTIYQMLYTTLKRVGSDTFFKYDSFRNNCQNFVFNMLVANNLMTPQLQAFILQPLDKLLEQQPGYLSKVAKTVTNIGHIFGLGKPSQPRGIDHAFSEDDIRAFCGNIPILRYPELANMTDPSELFQGKDGAALLFLTDGPSDGHWIAVLDKPDHYEVFDSFGTAIDGDRKWLDNHKLLEFGETAPLLSKLLKGRGKEVIHNTKKLQKDDADTCGRYVAARINRASTPLPDFIRELTANGRSPDVNVTLMTQGRSADNGIQGDSKRRLMRGGHGGGPVALQPAPPQPPHATHISILRNDGTMFNFDVGVDYDTTTINEWYNMVKASLPPEYAQAAQQSLFLQSLFEPSIVDQFGYTYDIDPNADDAGEGDGDIDGHYVLRAFMNGHGGGIYGPNQMVFAARFEPSPRVIYNDE